MRLTEYWFTVRGENLYTEANEKLPLCHPALAGFAKLTVAERELSFCWQFRPNAVWRRRRMFLTCGRCRRRATPLYVPTEDSWLACGGAGA